MCKGLEGRKGREGRCVKDWKGGAAQMTRQAESRCKHSTPIQAEWHCQPSSHTASPTSPKRVQHSQPPSPGASTPLHPRPGCREAEPVWGFVLSFSRARRSHASPPANSLACPTVACKSACYLSHSRWTQGAVPYLSTCTGVLYHSYGRALGFIYHILRTQGSVTRRTQGSRRTQGEIAVYTIGLLLDLCRMSWLYV